ncbi:MAG: hypothetical protein JKY48_16665 [Flavobacteriales bacterium]|nr:hypothetical protein [Flavobacteriales bacterium]
MIEVRKIVGEVVNLTNHIVHKVDPVNYKISIVLFGALVFLIIILTVFIDCPSQFQSSILRLSIALGISALISMFTGEWNVKGQSYKGPITFSLSILLYFMTSAAVVKADCSYSSIQGKIFMGNKPLKGALINLPQQDVKVLSNGSGSFLLQWESDESNSDSLLIQIQTQSIDTSFYWIKSSVALQINLRNPLVPISKNMVSDLVDRRIQSFESMMKASFLKWGSSRSISLYQLIEKYEAFDSRESKYRNEFLFQGLDQKIAFRKNLMHFGIIEVEQLNPYEKHHIDSSSIYLLEAKEFPNYKLEYYVQNERPIQYRIDQLQYVSDDEYKTTVSYQENVRNIRVLLNCSNETNGVKKRQMEVYGFLPVEEYVLKYRHGKWGLEN